MTLLDLVAAPWALHPRTYETIREVYDRHVLGDRLPPEQIQARIQDQQQARQGARTTGRQIAVIDLCGPICKKMNLLTEVSGGTSTELAARDLRAALDAPEVEAIILHVDSPGGTVDGTQELAQLVYSARGRKPAVAWSDGCIASGAYWIGSAAERVYISCGTVEVGSIGVVTSHVDRSRLEEMEGLKTTEIVAGKYKRIASGMAPLSTEGRKSLQDQVDYLYQVFVGDVARQRGVSVDLVLERMADGRIFIGERALKAGLVDGIRTFEEVVQELGSCAPFPASSGARLQTKRALTHQIIKEERTMQNPLAIPTGNAFPAPKAGPPATPEYIEGLLDVWEEHGVLGKGGRAAERTFVNQLSPAQLVNYQGTKQAEYDARNAEYCRASGTKPISIPLPQPQPKEVKKPLSQEEIERQAAFMLSLAPPPGYKGERN